MKSKAVAFALTAAAVVVALWAANNVQFVQNFVAPKPKTLG